jgi:hypothetical protein
MTDKDLFCTSNFNRCCEAGAEEPKLRIAAPALAPFYLSQTWRNVIEKNMVAEEVFVNCYNFNPISQVKKGNFQGIS